MTISEPSTLAPGLNISLGPVQIAIFRWPRAICTLWTAYKDLLTAAELPNGRRDKFHRIRRSVATHYEVAGGNATELLGHSCRAVTKSYLDATITGKVWAADLLFRPDGRDSA